MDSMEQASPSVVISEPYTRTEDGHFVGCDGFVVPKNFVEFFEREPMSVRRFLMKKLHRQMVDEVVLDLEQDLLLHLHYLPASSKHRKEGKTDIIQCFDPSKHHGASAKRFHNYLALCMNNRFCTIMHKQKKNPIYHKNNLSIAGADSQQLDRENSFAVTGEVSEEFLHNNSTFVAQMSRRDDENAHFRKLFVQQFRDYVQQAAPEILPVIDAISESKDLKDARLTLGVNGRTFDKQRETLDLLKDCFMRGENFATSKLAAKNRRNDRIRAAREAKKKKPELVLV